MTDINNPVLRGFNPDPSIIRVEEDYYIATSTFEWFPGVQIHHSKDLANWRLITRPLDRLTQLDMRGEENSCGIWAPCLSYDKGVYYLVYTDVKTKTWPFMETHNYVVTAKNIYGPWSEPVYLNSSGFDPSLYHDDDGRKWLLNMELDFRKDRPNMSGILIQEYSAEKQALCGPIHKIYQGTGAGGPEGPHLYKRNGYYYLLVAEGGTWSGHYASLSRSKTLFGPYALDPMDPVLSSKDAPDILLQRSGHASLVETQDGEWYMAHLCDRPLSAKGQYILGRETALQKVIWTKDGWIRLESGRNTPEVQVPAPDLPEYKFPETPSRDDFDSCSLSIDFQTLRLPLGEEHLSLTEREGYLRLKGRAFITSNYAQSLVARRQQAFCYTASTCVEFEPESYKQMAGLICMYDNRNFYYLNISGDENKGKSLNLISGNQGILEAVPLNIPGIDGLTRVYLKAKVEYEKLWFYYSKDGEAWLRAGELLDASRLSDEACGGFTGAFVGLCCQDMTGQKKHADFDYFEYCEYPER